MISSSKRSKYPPPPKKSSFVQDGRFAPLLPGVYFINDENGEIWYVGKSECIRSRLAGHPALHQGSSVAWIAFPLEDILFAESYYIGLLKPPGNFGGVRRSSKPSRRGLVRDPLIIERDRKEWISAAVAATMLDVTPATVHNWRREGVFKQCKTRVSPKKKGKPVRKRYRFHIDEIKKIAAEIPAS